MGKIDLHMGKRDLHVGNRELHIYCQGQKGRAPPPPQGLKGGFKEWVDGWVATTVLGRFDTYKGCV